MKAWIARVGLAFALVLVVYFLGHMSPTVVKAQSNVTIPKAWGHVVGVGGREVTLEAGDGTIRVVDITNGRLEGQVGRN